jgi:hypothetical protein
VVQVVECQLCKYETLNSNPGPTKKKKKSQQRMIERAFPGSYEEKQKNLETERGGSVKSMSKKNSGGHSRASVFCTWPENWTCHQDRGTRPQTRT